MEKQFSLLSSRPDVIVATPGRLAHHLSEIPDFHLKHCDLVIFDEADRLFEMVSSSLVISYNVFENTSICLTQTFLFP